MTLPRELHLTQYDGKPLLASNVVGEIERIAGPWQEATTQWDAPDAYQLHLTIGLDQNSTITLSNTADEQMVFDINAANRTLTAHRTAATGATSFNGTFSIPSMQAPLHASGNQLSLDIFVDQSSVELFASDGKTAMTNLVFPQTIYNRLKVSGADYHAQIRTLRSIWH